MLVEALQHMSWLFSVAFEVSEKVYWTLISPGEFRVTTQKDNECVLSTFLF